MRVTLSSLFTALALSLACNLHAAVRYVDLTCTNSTPPFLDWTTAATNIQDAIDAAVDGDQILVTNGVYQSGGKVMAGNLTNRVALNKKVTVQSVNGPWVTSIRGSGMTNGSVAVRCAWLTNSAMLVGFTLQGGATRTTGDPPSLQSGGGVWCASSNAIVANCLIVSNTALYYGGGVFQGTINNSLLCSNSVALMGRASYGANLNSCTVVSNSVDNSDIAVRVCRLTNCIVYYNGGSANYDSSASVLSYCCTTPAPSAGTGNFTAPPQLFADAIHLLAGSPCIGTGTNRVTGTDIFGSAWANPPSVGCAEWNPAPLVTAPQLKLTSDPVGFTVGNVVVGAQSPFTCWWLKDGSPLQDNGHFSSTQTPNLVATGVVYSDAGSYQLVVSNAFGVVTSSVAPLVMHCADVGGGNPTPPYSTWATAATNIQDAITVALTNEVVLVTNGLYATGGKSMDGIITNRVSVDKAILVESVNGPYATTIQGALDPASTNGLLAVRCAWLTNNAIMSGFTLFGGATRSWGSGVSALGGGVSGTSTSATLDHCLVVSNYTSFYGGGACRVTLNNCTVMGNRALGSGSGGGADTCTLKNCVVKANVSEQHEGGGVENCTLRNCSLTQNSSYMNGGAAVGGTLVNCTITGNISSGASGYGGAVYGATLTNCVVWGNLQRTSYPYTNYASCTLAYCCTDPLAPGLGNIALDPQLLADGVHVASTSPCLGAGAGSVLVGTDIDGQSWNNPPAIGCDEWQPAPVIALQPSCQVNPAMRRLSFTAAAAGQAPFSYFWSKDGAPLQDDDHYANSATPSLSVNNFGPEHAGAYQVVVSNAFGVVTSQVAQVVIHAVDAASMNPAAPYSSWATAAVTIQDAINASVAGDIVLVTNGVYANGGKVMAGDLINRVALNKALTVMSVNGPGATVIQGAWDAASTNGPGAVRCAWMTNGAVLHGFTLAQGATRASGDWGLMQSGGGAWGCSASAVVSGCVLSNNNAAYYGGGMSGGTLRNSYVCANQAGFGGGVYSAVLNNCTVMYNYVQHSGYGGGTCSCLMTNCIVMNNFTPVAVGYYSLDNNASWSGYSSQGAYTCTYPLISGPGNLNGNLYNPAFLGTFHIAATSPCRGAGNPLYASGADLDGESWANPPSMGCDEIVPANQVGPLSVTMPVLQTNVLVNRWAGFGGAIVGRATRVEWSYGDGTIATNLGVSASHQWAAPGDYIVTFTAFNTDNPGGVSTNVLVHVTNPRSPQLLSPMVVSNQFAFQFQGEQQANYTVQYTTDLIPPVAWQTLQSFTYSLGQVYQISDPAVTNGTRFYRVLAQ